MEQSNPTVAPYAKEGEMFVRVTAKAATKEEADAMCVPVVEELKKRIGNFVYGVDVVVSYTHLDVYKRQAK